MANYLQRPTVYEAIQWTGSNAAAIQAQVNVGNANTGGTAFTVDSNGNGILTIYYTQYPVAVNDWLVTANSNTSQPLTNTQFQAQYIAGTVWAVGA